MFFLLIVSLLYSIYIFKLFWKRENMRPIMVTTGTQTDDYDSEIDDDGHLDDNTEQLDEDPTSFRSNPDPGSHFFNPEVP